MADVSFALNHMVAPFLKLAAFMAMAKGLGVGAVEIRNDLAGNAITEGTSPEEVRAATAANGQSIISINALQRFNEWNGEREREARELAAYAARCGASALVLVPVNDGTGQANGERQGNLRVALKALKTILAENGIIGLVEPLGFTICSLRSKKEAVDAIRAVGGEDRFRLVHDTFHHVLAGEPELFAAMTGLVHISGVEDQAVAVDDMRDPHRVMVGASDRLDNIGQIRALIDAGYEGPFSFEPFAPSVHRTADVASMVRASMEFIKARI